MAYIDKNNNNIDFSKDETLASVFKGSSASLDGHTTLIASLYSKSETVIEGYSYKDSVIYVLAETLSCPAISISTTGDTIDTITDYVKINNNNDVAVTVMYKKSTDSVYTQLDTIGKKNYGSYKLSSYFENNTVYDFYFKADKHFDSSGVNYTMPKMLLRAYVYLNWIDNSYDSAKVTVYAKDSTESTYTKYTSSTKKFYSADLGVRKIDSTPRRVGDVIKAYLVIDSQPKYYTNHYNENTAKSFTLTDENATEGKYTSYYYCNLYIGYNVTATLSWDSSVKGYYFRPILVTGTTVKTSMSSPQTLSWIYTNNSKADFSSTLSTALGIYQFDCTNSSIRNGVRLTYDSNLISFNVNHNYSTYLSLEGIERKLPLAIADSDLSTTITLRQYKKILTALDMSVESSYDSTEGIAIKSVTIENSSDNPDIYGSLTVKTASGDVVYGPKYTLIAINSAVTLNTYLSYYLTNLIVTFEVDTSELSSDYETDLNTTYTEKV